MKKLTDEEKDILINTLKLRFENNMNRHKNIKFEEILKKLTEENLYSLNEMEKTGGEPDVVNYEKDSDSFIFFDCSKETPKERLNTCYDKTAREKRKKFPPETSALEMAEKMGITILNEEEYRFLQTLGEYDLKTSSWIKTPNDIRELGGAIFADRRYNNVFIYHNGADSYYSSRGFRGSLKI